MEVVLTTGAIRRAKLWSKCHHQQTNTQFLLPGCLSCPQPTVSKHWKEMIHNLFTVNKWLLRVIQIVCLIWIWGCQSSTESILVLSWSVLRNSGIVAACFVMNSNWHWPNSSEEFYMKLCIRCDVEIADAKAYWEMFWMPYQESSSESRQEWDLWL